MTFEECYKLGTDIIKVMKAVDSGALFNRKDVIGVRREDGVTQFVTHHGFFVGYRGWVTKFYSSINHTLKRVILSQKYGCVNIFLDGNLVGINNDDPILAPTEEQYFQNSLVYCDEHLRIFVIYGLILQHKFKHKTIQIEYQYLDEILKLIDGGTV